MQWPGKLSHVKNSTGEKSIKQSKIDQIVIICNCEI